MNQHKESEETLLALSASTYVNLIKASSWSPLKPAVASRQFENHHLQI